MEKDRSRMVELNKLLREASRAYYQESREIMSNLEYDELYDELLRLEQETGMVLSDSVTQNVGYEIVSELPKVEHEKPMLSLDKTKSVDDLKAWLGAQKALLSWKLDGLTIVLTYRGGELDKAVTRGNGYIGELVTSNAKCFQNVPLRIPYKGELVLRGEAVITYSDFNRINDTISEADAKYKNPRNLCSGSVRQLDPGITRTRSVRFFAFSLVSAGSGEDAVDFGNSNENKFIWLKNQGFDVVEYVMTDAENIYDAVAGYADRISGYDVPSDGLVLLMDDIAYGESLGMTSKFPRNAIAFKWSDETAETRLKYIEWSPSRTGLINPVAVFEPVEIEGSTVSRASVHNLSILESLALGEGDTITVYKANMIIPQIAENLTRSGAKNVPEICPVCGSATKIKNENEVKTLYCTNPDCPVKQVKTYALLASRDAMNIEGLSEMTLEKLTSAGFIKSCADIFRLERYREDIAAMDGFGEKSADNLIAAAARAAVTSTARFIYSLGIPGIGSANAKMLAKHYGYDFDRFRASDVDELTDIEGIGPVLARSINSFFADEEKKREVDELLSVVTLKDEKSDESAQKLANKTFVITGSLMHFPNREALVELIESHGGKCASSVSKKTDYLINNDITSASGKNKKAKELGVPIIKEEDLLTMF